MSISFLPCLALACHYYYSLSTPEPESSPPSLSCYNAHSNHLSSSLLLTLFLPFPLPPATYHLYLYLSTKAQRVAHTCITCANPRL